MFVCAFVRRLALWLYDDDKSEATSITILVAAPLPFLATCFFFLQRASARSHQGLQAFDPSGRMTTNLHLGDHPGQPILDLDASGKKQSSAEG